MKHNGITIWLLSGGLLAACEVDKISVDAFWGDNNGHNGDSDSGIKTDSDMGATCGDGLLDELEACDDGNRLDGDGCASDCLTVEEGWACHPPGEPCQRMTRCGDGLVLFPEICDDGNIRDGDGCSSSCEIEMGFKCEGSPSSCFSITCGDGVLEGAETCDDGNILPFDGCDANCRLELQCPVGLACTSMCGDGIVHGDEACDDGNSRNGDGCSDVCTVEPGFVCEDGVATINDQIVLPIILRDFRSSDVDFEYPDDLEDDLAWGLIEANTELIQETLGPDKKPYLKREAAVTNDDELLNNGLIHSPESFHNWYVDSVNSSDTVVSELILFDDDGDGKYTNRYGALGQKWERLGEEYEGNPVFFPMDNQGTTPMSEYEVARIPPNYFGLPEGASVEDECTLGEGCNPCWPIECITGDEWADPGGDCAPENNGVTWYDCYDDSPRHNFHFTTQAAYWFQYEAGNTYTLSFVGDDDLWIFVKGQLVVDLGGIHMPLEKTVTLNPKALGLVDGNVYEIVVFHADRQTNTSTFKLTLSGFSTRHSVCLPDCGDGIVTIGEECDDGINDGGYNECAPGCVLGEYCGDGIIQEEFENCDDGNFMNGDSCPASCRE